MGAFILHCMDLAAMSAQEYRVPRYFDYDLHTFDQLATGNGFFEIHLQTLLCRQACGRQSLIFSPRRWS
jgi:hypothetical protein